MSYRALIAAWVVVASLAAPRPATAQTEPVASSEPSAAEPEPSAAEASREPSAPEPEPSVAEASSEPSAPEASAVAPMRGRSDRRPVPDYDSLPDPGPTTDEVMIWIPRTFLMPLYLVTEFLVRRPVGELLMFAERNNVIPTLINFFTWDHRRAGLVPVAFYDFGLLPSVGLYHFWNDLGAPGHQLRVRASFGGVDWLRATIRDRVLLDRRVELSFRADGYRWPDRVYQGLGARSERAARARYRQNQLSGSIDLGVELTSLSRLRVEIGVTWADFSADGYDEGGGDPSLANAIATPGSGLNELPPGFDGYLAYHQRLELTLDSRRRPTSEHGVRLDVHAEHGVDLQRGAERGWLRYGGMLAGYLDLGMERVLSLHVAAAFADPLGTAEVPFTEQVRLGGGMLLLPGFLVGALVGRSAATLTLRYRWPIWVWLDASLFVGAGNVFDEHLRDFDLSLLRLSWGFVFQTLGDRDHSFRVGLAFGTRQTGLGADVESVRFTVGGNLGF